jgi:hypothetical protein
MSAKSILCVVAMSCVVLLQSAGAQPIQTAAEGSWKLLDRVETIVNEEIVTLRQLDREIGQRQREGKITKESDLEYAKNEILRRSISERLASQAGQDLGVDPALIQRHVDNYLNREKARSGVAAMASKLQEKDLSAGEYRLQIERMVYSQIWDDVVTGSGESPTTHRVSADRYVRPGRVHFEYQRAAPRPDRLPLLGGQPQTVVLQMLIVDPNSFGGDVQAARKLAAQLREQILDGEDMGELNQRHGAEKQRFQLEPVEEARLVTLEPTLGEFVTDAQPGDVSEVMAYSYKNHDAWRIVRLVARNEAQVPDLASLPVQHKLTKEIEDVYEAYRRDSALVELFRSSYVWPPQLRGNSQGTETR